MSSARPSRQRWRRSEYERLIGLGFFRGRRVELVHGEIVRMPPMKNLHAVALALVGDELGRAFAGDFWVRAQMPLYLGKRSAPEPDLAVVPGRPRDYQSHPTSALLVVEISETSLRYDRGRKAALYAWAGSADYWLVNLVDRQLEVYRQPGPDRARPRRSSYQQRTVYDNAGRVAPLARAGDIAIADLLP